MKIIFKYFKKYIFLYLIGFAALIIVDIAQILQPQVVRGAIDKININITDFKGLLVSCALLMGIAVTIFITRFIWRFFILGASRRIEYHVRNDMFAHLEILSSNFFNRNKTGDLMAHFTNDLNAIRMSIGFGLMMGFDSIIMIAMIILMCIFTISPFLTLIAIIPLPLLSLSALLFGNLLTKRFKDKQAAFSKLTDYVQESISGIRVIKAFIQDSLDIIMFDKTNKHNMEMNLKLIKVFALIFPLALTISGLSLGINLLLGGYLTIISRISLGQFVAFSSYMTMLIWPMIALGWCINIFSQGYASMQRVQKIIETEPDIFDKTDAVEKKEFEKDLQIKKLDFSYNETDNYQLNNINFTIEKGKSMAIVGKTGCGKSTLVSLLSRLYNPPEKTIFIDGIDILDISLKSLRDIIGFIPQDSFLFSDTIYNNISFGIDYSDAESLDENIIYEAAKIADIHKNIIEFPDKYETLVGERGVTLSGGQKQRIGIARIIAKDPDILIMDDSLSSVDSNTEENIINRIKEIRKGKTTIIIAHRISTIQFADNIIVIDEGRLAESGTHNELLEKKGIYYDIYQKQLLQKELEE